MGEHLPPRPHYQRELQPRLSSGAETLASIIYQEMSTKKVVPVAVEPPPPPAEKKARASSQLLSKTQQALLSSLNLEMAPEAPRKQEERADPWVEADPWSAKCPELEAKVEASVEVQGPSEEKLEVKSEEPLEELQELQQELEPSVEGAKELEEGLEAAEHPVEEEEQLEQQVEEPAEDVGPKSEGGEEPEIQAEAVPLSIYPASELLRVRMFMQNPGVTWPNDKWLEDFGRQSFKETQL